MFQFTGFPPYAYSELSSLIQHTVTEVSSAGFPHSDICGSQLMCSSPQLFAAYHVFLRLSVPRHPPCALSCLTSCSALLHPSSLLSGAPCFAFVPSVALLWSFGSLCLVLVSLLVSGISLRLRSPACFLLSRPRMSLSRFFANLI